MTEHGRRPDIERLLHVRGWTQPDKPEIHVYQEYRPNKKRNPHLPWEIVLYHKVPVWRWDFIDAVILGTRIGDKRSYKLYDPKPGSWIVNQRNDFEFHDVEDAEIVANSIDSTLQWEYDHDYIDRDRHHPPIAVQRIEDRPTKEQLNG